MSIKIAIPSHNRTNITTLELLSEFPREDIYIFVNDEEQRNKYKEVHKFLNVIQSNTKGIQQARNYILDFFGNDTEVLMLDDDIEKFLTLEGGVKNFKIQKKLNEMTNTQVKEFVEKGFEVARKNNVKLWGIYPVENPFYMSAKLDNKGFIIGSFSGIIVDDIRMDNNLQLKEDYDYTLQHIIKNKKVMRYNNYTMKIKHYSNAGGVVDLRNEKQDMEQRCCDYLLKKYPFFLKANPKRENELLISL